MSHAFKHDNDTGGNGLCNRIGKQFGWWGKKVCWTADRRRHQIGKPSEYATPCHNLKLKTQKQSVYAALTFFSSPGHVETGVLSPIAAFLDSPWSLGEVVFSAERLVDSSELMILSNIAEYWRLCSCWRSWVRAVHPWWWRTTKTLGWCWVNSVAEVGEKWKIMRWRGRTSTTVCFYFGSSGWRQTAPIWSLCLLYFKEVYFYTCSYLSRNFRMKSRFGHD